MLEDQEHRGPTDAVDQLKGSKILASHPMPTRYRPNGLVTEVRQSCCHDHPVVRSAGSLAPVAHLAHSPIEDSGCRIRMPMHGELLKPHGTY